MAKTKDKAKSKPKHRKHQACPQGKPLREMPYPYDGLERPVTALSGAEALTIVGQLVKPTTAIIVLVIELCQGAAQSGATLFPEDVAEVLSLAHTQLFEAERICHQWRAEHLPQPHTQKGALR
jgi:hypothetical protein